MFKLFFYGLIAKFLNFFIKTRDKHWAFSADYGKMYREGSKYLMEYMLQEHPDYQCTFFTMNKAVYEELKQKGIPCKMNLSIAGIIAIAKCSVVFTTQSISDIRYAFKKKNRHYYYMTHGMPYKHAWAMLPKGHIANLINNSKWKKRRNKISASLTLGYKMKDVSFIPSCSEFLKGWQEKEFPGINIRVTGMARNDVLFDDERMRQEQWIDGTDGKFVIVYMPTHRGYGAGEVSPVPFLNRPDVQKWLEANNVVLLVKNHPNMVKKMSTVVDTPCIKDISKAGLDPQVCIYHSDVLITDHSSVWMDYLLLRRPIIFYLYDDFEHDDVGTYYDIRQEHVGHVCEDEDGLFNLIQQVKANYAAMCPEENVIRKFHQFVDGNSCERMFNEVNKDQ